MKFDGILGPAEQYDWPQIIFIQFDSCQKINSSDLI